MLLTFIVFKAVKFIGLKIGLTQELVASDFLRNRYMFIMMKSCFSKI